VNYRQAAFIILSLLVGLVTPNFAVAMFFMGLATGGFLVIILQQ